MNNRTALDYTATDDIDVPSYPENGGSIFFRNVKVEIFTHFHYKYQQVNVIYCKNPERVNTQCGQNESFVMLKQ